MRGREVFDVDVVAHAGAIGSGVVRAEHRQEWQRHRADATQGVEITVLEGVAFTNADQANFRVGQSDTFAITLSAIPRRR